LAERFGSGAGERDASMTRQIAFEPLPASVWFAFGRAVDVVVMSLLWNDEDRQPAAKAASKRTP
jgi:hypothetical protein